MIIKCEHLPHQDSLPLPSSDHWKCRVSELAVTSSTQARLEDIAVPQAMHLPTEFHESGHSCQGCSLLKGNESISGSVVSDSLRLRGLPPTRLLRPWDSSGQNTGVGCHFFLQGIFMNQGSNWGLLHCRQILYRLSHRDALLLREGVSTLRKRGFLAMGVRASVRLHVCSTVTLSGEGWSKIVPQPGCESEHSHQ